jgi:hypothetical protein
MLSILPVSETEAKWITLTHIYMTDTEREAKWITLTHIYMTDTERGKMDNPDTHI